MIFVRLVTIATALFCWTLACKSKNNRVEEKIRNIECNFTNTSAVYNNNTDYGGVVSTILPRKLIFFKAHKPNIAILPCYENNVRFFEYEPEDNPEARIWSEFANNPTECQSFCQATKICEYFTYKFDSNRCWFFHKGLNLAQSKFKEEGYISGPKYCETLHPEFKGGFKINIEKPWSKFNDTFAWKELPSVITHGWDVCKRICSINQKCTSFDYCFVKETSNFEIFQCYMKGNTYAESLLKSPNHCVKSTKKIVALYEIKFYTLIFTYISFFILP